MPGKSGIANNGCGAARRMTPYCSSEVKGLNESLPCDLLESFGCRAGSQQLTQRRRKKLTPQQNCARKETEWHVQSIAAFGIGWGDFYTSLDKNIVQLQLWICLLSKMLMLHNYSFFAHVSCLSSEIQY